MIPIRSAFREKYAWGKISPKRVMQMDEKKNAQRPERTESVKRVKSTLMLTLPQSRVVKSRFASALSSRTWTASWFPDSTSISSFKRLKPNKPRVRPENKADWVKQKKIPNKMARSIQLYNSSWSCTQTPIECVMKSYRNISFEVLKFFQCFTICCSLIWCKWSLLEV